MQRHVDNYFELIAGVTGRELNSEGMLTESARVYNFQRVFNIRMGKGLRAFDEQPYRAAGPVTPEEYESRQERYDSQLVELIGKTPEEVAGMDTAAKIAAHREWREGRYEQLLDAVYEARGWTSNAVPKPERLKELGIDYPEVMEIVTGQLKKDK